MGKTQPPNAFKAAQHAINNAGQRLAIERKSRRNNLNNNERGSLESGGNAAVSINSMR